MDIQRIPVSKINPAKYNPRKITDSQLKALKRAMEEFGDLSGIVVNMRTGNLIGGHQRLKNFDPAWQICKRPESDNVGTVAAGYIETPWGRWAYREVDWEDAKEKAANLAANKIGGEFDLPKLRDLLADIQASDIDAALTGFDQAEIEKMLQGSGPHSPDHYNDEKPANIYWPKLAHRIELCAMLPRRDHCVELYAGRGILSEWYERLFKKVTRCDKQSFDGIHMVGEARTNISKLDWSLFDLVDFDDEGCPGPELQTFFRTVKADRPFGLAVTDGMGLNFKSRGKVNLYRSYLIGEDKTQQATGKMYDDFDEIFRTGIKNAAALGDYELEKISQIRRENGNAIYATYIVRPSRV